MVYFVWKFGRYRFEPYGLYFNFLIKNIYFGTSKFQKKNHLCSNFGNFSWEFFSCNWCTHLPNTSKLSGSMPLIWPWVLIIWLESQECLGMIYRPCCEASLSKSCRNSSFSMIMETSACYTAPCTSFQFIIKFHHFPWIFSK